MNRGEELPAETWAEDALCAGVDSATFRSVDTIPTALGICSHCPVSRECLTWALDNNITTDTWGNKTARQRRHLSSEDVAFWPPPLIPSVVITAGPVAGGPARVVSTIGDGSQRPPSAAPKQPVGSKGGERKPPSNCDNRCSETGTNASVRHYNRGESACRESLDAARRYRANQKADKAAFEASKRAAVAPTPEDAAPVVDSLLDEADATISADITPPPSEAPVVKQRIQVRWLVPNEVLPLDVAYEYSYRTEDGQQDVVISARIAEIRASQGKRIRRRTVTAWQDVGGGEGL